MLAAKPGAERCRRLCADLPSPGGFETPRVAIAIYLSASRSVQEWRVLGAERENEARSMCGSPPGVGCVVEGLHCVATQVGGFIRRGHAGG